MKDNIIIRVISNLLIPFIQLYALYVLAHGDLGPGGGFQGGVIFAAAIILYVLVYGIDEGRKRVHQKITDVLNSIGVMIYGGIGVACLLFGGYYLQYGKLPLGDLKHASHLGIYGIEIGVEVTVAAVMVTIFFEMAGRKND